MTCNYKNSAGTDLDSIFTVNNSNAGAIGFKTSDGTDLGNRFASGSIGTNVGYKNAAGTDIGYLRAKITVPSFTSHSASGPLNGWSKDGCTYRGTCYDTDSDGNITGEYECSLSMRSLHNKGYVTVNGACSCGSTEGLVWDVIVYYWHTECGYTHHVTWTFALNTTTPPANNKPCAQETTDKVTCPCNTESNGYYTILDGSSGSNSRSITFAYHTAAQDGRGGNGNGEHYLRVKQRFRNSVGSTGWVYDDVRTN